jgi:hypothetical protein
MLTVGERPCGMRPMSWPRRPLKDGLLLVCFSRTSNFSAIWRLSPLLATGLQILDLRLALMAFSNESSFTCHT